MSKKKKQPPEIPSVEALAAELARVKYQSRFRQTLMGTIYVLITVAAAAILVATLWLPVLRISGASMAPTLEEGELVVAVRNSSFERGS